MRTAGRLVGEVLTAITGECGAGGDRRPISMSWPRALITRAGAIPAFKGYHGYPATICASINDEVIHGIPVGRDGS